MHTIRLRLVLWVSLLSVPLLAAEVERYWEGFPPLPGSQRVSQMGVDAHNGLWVLAKDKCFYWDREQKDWGAKLGDTPCLYGFLGTAETGLVAVTADQQRQEGQVIRLLDGQATPVTTFALGGRYTPVGLRLCRDGRLFNAVDSRCGVYSNGAWSHWDLGQSAANACLVDLGEAISLLADGKLYLLDGTHGIRTLPVAEPRPGVGTSTVPWGRDRILAYRVGEKELVAFSALTGERVDTSRINEQLGGRPIRYLSGLPDGSVWVVVSDYAGSARFLCRISADGEVRPLRGTVGLEWNAEAFFSHSRRVVAETSGRIWFTDPDQGVSWVDDQDIEQFVPDQDGSPANPTALALDRDGMLYALGKGGLFVYNQGRSLTGGTPPLPHQRRSLGEPVWQTSLVDGTVVRTRRSGRTALLSVDNPDRTPWGLLGIDLPTGDGLFAFRQGEADHDKPVCAGATPGQFLFTRGNDTELWDVSPWLLHNRLPVGEIATRLAKARPTALQPIWFPMLALPDGRCVAVYRTGVLCVDGKGQLAWDRAFPPGFPNGPLAVAGDLLIAQMDNTGNVLCGLDLGTGKPRWAKRSSYQGAGFALFPDGQRLIEAARWGELTCRRCADGEATWSYRRSGTELHTPPVIDPLARSIYVYFDDAVACLRADTGELVWEHPMPDPPFHPHTRELLPGTERLQLADGVLLATDEASTLVLLDAATGQPLAHFPLKDTNIRYGKRVAGDELAGAPWLDGGNLVVPRSTGLSAYRLPVAAYLPPATLPEASWAEPPPERIAGTEAEFAVAAKGTGELVVHYRLDSGDWRRQPCAPPVQKLRVDGLTSGQHWLRLVVQDAAGRMSGELQCRLRVVAEGPSEEEIVVTRSGPPEIDAAARAEQALRAIGGEVHPRLATRRLPANDPVLCEFASLLPPAPTAVVATPAGPATATQPAGAGGIPQPPGDGARYWERFPPPAGLASRITQVALDQEGGLWAMTQHSCFHWDAENREWRDSGLAFAFGGKLSPGGNGEDIHGGPETGLYVSPSGDWQDPERKVYRLAHGEAKLVTTIPRKSPPLQPLRDGRLVTLTTKELRIFAGGQWHDYPFGVNAPKQVQAFDLGDVLCVCRDGSLLLVDSQGKTGTATIELVPAGDLTMFARVVSWHGAALWGKDRALLGAPNDDSLPRILDLRTGKQEEASALQVALADRSVRNQCSLADGSLLLTVADSRTRTRGLCRVSTDGTVRQLAAGMELPLPFTSLQSASDSYADDAAGGLWLTLPKAGVLHLGAEGWVRQFDPDADGSPAWPSSLVADAQGIVYVISEGDLYAYNVGKSLTGQGTPAPRRLLAPGYARWRRGFPGDVAVDSVTRVGDTALLRPVCRRGSCEVAAVDLVHGQPRFQFPLPEGEKDWYSVGAGTGVGELTVRRSSGLVVLDAHSGAEVRTLPWLGEAKEDGHPLPLREDRLFLPRWNGPVLPFFDQLGRKVWELDTAKLGSLAELPVAQGGVALFQTRSSRSASLLTLSLVDLDSGQVVWSKADLLRGGRMAFLMDGEWGVGFGRPDRRDQANLGLVCLDTRSGEQRWACDLPTSTHRGLVVDAASRRIYLYFADGSVGCVDGDLGALLWRTPLPHLPFSASDVWHPDSPSSLALDSGMVLATDNTAVLTLLDMATGTILGHLRLTEAPKSKGGIQLARTGLLAPPWVVRDHVVVATAQGLVAYSFPPSGCLPCVKPLALAWASPPPDHLAEGTLALAVSASDQGLILKRRLDDGNWEQEPLVSSEHTTSWRGLADQHHRVRLVLVAPDGRWSNELVHEFGEKREAPREITLPAAHPGGLVEVPVWSLVAAGGRRPAPLPPEGRRYWECFPGFPGQLEPVSFVGVDAGNGIWVMVGFRCWHWEGRKRIWVEEELPEGSHWERFFGGGKQGLYATCRKGTETHWEIRRLEAGTSRTVTVAEHRSGGQQPPGFHLTGDGRILTWSSSQIRLHAAGSWQDWDAQVEPEPAIIEHGDLVSVFSKNTLCTIDSKGTATRVPVDPAVAVSPMAWAKWGDDRVLLFVGGANPGIQGFRLADGALVDTSGINRLVRRDDKLQRLLSLPGGTVLLLVYTPAEDCQRVYRITPDGKVEEAVAARGLPREGRLDYRRRPQPLVEPGGRVWFPSESAGVSSLEGDRFRQFDCRTDGSPFCAEGFALGLDGVLYAVGDRRLYAYNQGTSVSGASRPGNCLVASLGDEIWHVRMSAGASLYDAKRFGTAAAGWVADPEGRKLLGLDLAREQVGVQIPLAKEADTYRLPGPGRVPAEMAVCSESALAFLETATGKTVKTLPGGPGDRDPSPPLLLPEHRLLWLGKGRRWLACYTEAGEFAWQFPENGDKGEALQPYLVPGGHLLVQGSNWGDKPGSLYAVAPDTGTCLWQTPARCDAISLMATDDGAYVVTVRRDSRKTDADFWLACWLVESGRKVWEYNRPNVGLYQTPVYDPGSQRVCAYFDDGAVICFDVRDGKPRWKRQLALWPLTSRPRNWSPQFSDSLQQSPGMVLATDRAGVATVLSIYTGAVLARYDLGVDDVSGDKRTARTLPLVPPWLVGEQLVVCHPSAIRALPFPLADLRQAAEATRPEGEEAAPELSVEELNKDAPASQERKEPMAANPRLIADDRVVRGLVAQLGAAKFADRQAAKEALLRLGKLAAPHLEAYRDHADPEVRQQVREILKALK